MAKPPASKPDANKAGGLPAKAAEGSSPTTAEIEGLLASALEGKVEGRDLKRVAARITSIVLSERFSGPIPHPSHLREYENTLPGAAERIFTMAEKRLDHNIAAEKSIINDKAAENKRGMNYGAALFALLIMCAYLSLFVTDNAVVPGIFLGIAVIGGITKFITRGGDNASS